MRSAIITMFFFFLSETLASDCSRICYSYFLGSYEIHNQIEKYKNICNSKENKLKKRNDAVNIVASKIISQVKTRVCAGINVLNVAPIHQLT